MIAAARPATPTPPRFAGKVALVTGAASGIGRKVAIDLAAEGVARLVLLDRDKERLEATQREIDRSVTAIACNIADENAIEQVLHHESLSSGLDVAVSAAGILGPTGSLAHCSIEAWDALFATNVRGTFLTVRMSIALMTRRGGGSIVLFGSTAGLAGSGNLGAYSATKGAIAAMTRSLALAHGPDNIRVNSVCPGAIETPMLGHTLASAHDENAGLDLRRGIQSKYPLGRFGTPEEVSRAVLFLASDEASFVTGVNMPVDGGRLA